jgi:anaerobic ribonucleoside-triphosphate reductase activating protein
MLHIGDLYFPAMSYEGEGMALAIYFQGCTNNCKGCHNPKFKNPNSYLALDITPPDLVERIMNLSYITWIDSFIFTGGEPLQQSLSDIVGLAIFLRKRKDIPIWLYTSVLFENIEDYVKREFDVIVDGPFMEKQKRKNLRFRGSENQRIWVKIADVKDGSSMWAIDEQRMKL